jgi:hypothetical protein
MIILNVTKENFDAVKQKALQLGLEFLNYNPGRSRHDITAQGICVRIEKGGCGWELMEDLGYYDLHYPELKQISSDDFLALCFHPGHNPPDIKMNGRYRHVCPECKKTTYL